MKVLAVVPAFNEEECLANTISELKATCPEVDYLVVNDGSSDGTADVISSKHLNGVNLPVNTGLTSAFRTGMKYARRNGYDAVVQFDADGQHMPFYIPAMAQTMCQKTITDPTSGMRMYSRRMIDLFATGFDIAPEPDLVALAARKYGPVVEVQAQMRERQGGESYLKLGNVIRYMSRTCLAIVMSRFLR